MVGDIMRHDPFSLPIWQNNVYNWEELRPKILELLPEWDDSYRQYGNVFTDYHLYAGKTQLPEYCQEVLTILERNIFEWQERSNLQYIDITEMWAQHYKKGDGHPLHNHGAQGFSAILYVTLDYAEHATLFHAPFNDPIDGNVITWQPKVREGDLIIFPSMLHHVAPQINFDANKTIISFNINGRHSLPKLRMEK
jgi:hypothetical protein